MARGARKSEPARSLRAELGALMLIPALSGHEGRVRRFLAAEMKAMGLATRTDRLGNLIATVKGTGKAVDLGALLVGVYEDGGLRYAGKIGAGFTNSNRDELLAAVAPLAESESPFAAPVPRAAARNAQWLRPELVIRAEFAGWTGDGLVRQAAYKGIELEKDPHKVIRERPKS